MDIVIVSDLFQKNNYYLSYDGSLEKGDIVLFQGESDLLFGKVLVPLKNESRKNLNLPLKNIIRKVTAEDEKKIKENFNLAADAKSFARKVSLDLDLSMSFVNVFFTFNKKQLVLEYTSDNRVDFRELAKKLASKYKTRIELYQIGVRDKAKRLGGLGPCGLFLCCNTFLTDFASVSINMAKNQNLALTPSKINGVCGRLLCCLSYEDDIYNELKNNIYLINSFVDTKYGRGKVINFDGFKNFYTIELVNKSIVEINYNDIYGSSE